MKFWQNFVRKKHALFIVNSVAKYKPKKLSVDQCGKSVWPTWIYCENCVGEKSFVKFPVNRINSYWNNWISAAKFCWTTVNVTTHLTLNISQTFFFVFNRKVIWKDMRLSKQCLNFHFGVNHNFKICLLGQGCESVFCFCPFSFVDTSTQLFQNSSIVVCKQYKVDSYSFAMCILSFGYYHPMVSSSLGFMWSKSFMFVFRIGLGGNRTNFRV